MELTVELWSSEREAPSSIKHRTVASVTQRSLICWYSWGRRVARLREFPHCSEPKWRKAAIWQDTSLAVYVPVGILFLEASTL